MFLKIILALGFSLSSFAAFGAYAVLTQPGSAQMTMDEFVQLLKGEKVGPLNGLSLREYVAMSVKTKPGDPIGYYCDGSFCTPLSDDISLADILSGTWLLSQAKVVNGFHSVMPGKKSGIVMNSERERQERFSKISKINMDRASTGRPMGMNAISW